MTGLVEGEGEVVDGPLGIALGHDLPARSSPIGSRPAASSETTSSPGTHRSKSRWAGVAFSYHLFMFGNANAAPVKVMTSSGIHTTKPTTLWTTG